MAPVPAGSFAQWNRSRLRRCDPYLVWADITTTPEPLPPGEQRLNAAVLVELNRSGDLPAVLDRLNGTTEGTIRFVPSGVEESGSRFVTGRATHLGLRRLVRLVLAGVIARFTLQDPRTRGIDQAEGRLQLRIQTQQRMTPKQVRALGFADVADAVSAPRRQGSFLGVIDDGLPFARTRLLAPPMSGHLSLWDQGWTPRAPEKYGGSGQNGVAIQKNDPYWRPPLDVYMGPLVSFRGFLYGRRLRDLPAPNGDDYALGRYFSPAPRHRHGAAVLGLLAPWLAAPQAQAAWPAHISGLAMVQLPTATVQDTAGGSLAMRVLDGLRYILWQEQISRPDSLQPRPVVVNVSYGTHAGPHDGSSMGERALREALDRHPHLHLVLPAGNAHRAGCHAQCRLTPRGTPGSEATLKLRVLPDNPDDSFVELWLQPGAEVRLRIRAPGAASDCVIGAGQVRVVRATAATGPLPQYAVIYADEVAQGLHGTMVLLAIGPTRNDRRRVAGELQPRGQNAQPRVPMAAPAGLWTLTVSNQTSRSTRVDGWIERNDSAPDETAGARQAFFPDSCAEEYALDNAIPEGTLNGIATLRHARLYVVGAMRRDGRLSDYSAAGAGHPIHGRRAPDAVVGADWSATLPGLKTMGFTAGTVSRINGTSAACAVYARALAEQLHRAPQKPVTGARAPRDPPPEIDCAPEHQPKAAETPRGQVHRRFVPSAVFPVDGDSGLDA